MAYIVNNFNGTFLTSVSDGTIDTTTDIRFVGKNYAGYGEIQNENFLHLLENFANTTPPPKAVIGQIWYDSTSTEKKLKFWDGTNWKIAGGAKSQSTAPTGELTAGEFWWDTASKQLYAWSGTEFVLVGPDTSPDIGASAVSARVVKDSNGFPHTIVEIKSSGVTVAIVSEDDDFLLNTVENSIAGFNPPNSIKKGITLSNTGSSGITSTQHRFWGTASNALKLGGIDASELQKLISGQFSQDVNFSDNGFFLGNRNNFRIKVENTDQLIIENNLGEDITVRIGPETSSNIAIFDNLGIKPAFDNTLSLGRINDRWKDLYATNIFSSTISGNLTGDVLGNHTGNVFAANGALMLDHTINFVGSPDGSTRFRGIFTGTFGTLETPANVNGSATLALSLSTPVGQAFASLTSSPISVVIRDENNDITARQFKGTADKADLLKFGSNYVSASSIVPGGTDKSSIAARDSAGDIYATLFRGTATAARYADLAEKYLTDKQYDIGTVVAVGGESEVRASVFGDRAIGVISENPAYMMNSELEGGTYVALKGRVPVKVIGSIKKGDRLIATDNGCAVYASIHQYSDVFGISLEDNSETGIKLVEAIIL